MGSLEEDTVIAAAFPGELPHIVELRNVDGEFDEICSDFVLLARIAGSPDRAADKDDILEGLLDLKREITSALRGQYKDNSSTERKPK